MSRTSTDPETRPDQESSGNNDDGDLLKAGELLQDRFKVDKLLGNGGMAYVYLGSQINLNRQVAIKVLNPRLTKDDQFIERFQSESRIMSSISHKNIVSVIDCGVSNGLHFIVMEYISGQTLDHLIDEKKLAKDEWLNVIQSCSSALQYLHKNRLLHLDIKASNILISDEGNVYLSDFGISRLQDENPDTHDGMAGSGTARYMSPEQIDCSSEIDHRSDIFSLAVSFYKMLTGSFPSLQIKKPSDLNSKLSNDVDRIISRALNEKPEDRFNSVKEFCDTLMGALNVKNTAINTIQRSSSSISKLTTMDEISKKDGVEKDSPIPLVRKPNPDKSKKVKEGTSKSFLYIGITAVLAVILIGSIIISAVLFKSESHPISASQTANESATPLVGANDDEVSVKESITEIESSSTTETSTSDSPFINPDSTSLDSESAHLSDSPFVDPN